ncbi:MAG: STAS domain-containing protein [Burkholderiales bacterium]|nr:STAS domain-containing protein [Burkholderiales bacterium]
MIRRDGDRLVVEGAVTMEEVPGLLAQGLMLLDRGETRIDLAGVTAADSSAVALLLEWLRAAQRAGGRIVYLNLDNSLKSLADLYGVTELLPLARA